MSEVDLNIEKTDALNAILHSLSLSSIEEQGSSEFFKKYKTIKSFVFQYFVKVKHMQPKSELTQFVSECGIAAGFGIKNYEVCLAIGTGPNETILVRLMVVTAKKISISTLFTINSDHIPETFTLKEAFGFSDQLEAAFGLFIESLNQNRYPTEKQSLHTHSSDLNDLIFF